MRDESAAALADVTLDAAEVEGVAEEDNAGVGVLAVWEERSQRGIAPSEPPKTRIGGTGHVLARRIPAQARARARAATLAPRVCRYRAHRLLLEVRARIASSRHRQRVAV